MDIFDRVQRGLLWVDTFSREVFLNDEAVVKVEFIDGKSLRNAAILSGRSAGMICIASSIALRNFAEYFLAQRTLAGVNGSSFPAGRAFARSRASTGDRLQTRA